MNKFSVLTASVLSALMLSSVSAAPVTTEGTGVGNTVISPSLSLSITAKLQRLTLFRTKKTKCSLRRSSLN